MLFKKFKNKNIPEKEDKNQMVTIEEVKQLFAGLSESDKAAFLHELTGQEAESAPPADENAEATTENTEAHEQETTPAPAPESDPETNPENEQNTPEPTADETSEPQPEPTTETPQPTQENSEIGKVLEEVTELKKTIEAMKAEMLKAKREPQPAPDDKSAELDKLMSRYNA